MCRQIAICSECGKPVTWSKLELTNGVKDVYAHPVSYLRPEGGGFEVDWDSVCNDWMPVEVSNHKQIAEPELASRHGIAVFLPAPT